MQSSSKEQLKLIALNILDNCAPFIKKNLLINNPYLFYNDYTLSEPNNAGQRIITHNPNTHQISSTFFSDIIDKNPIISISAIVGKNGSGKSALIDIILRLINNIACKILSDKVDAEIMPVSNVYAQLYFAIGEKFYLLQQMDERIILYYYENSKWNNVGDAKKILMEHFYYTIVMNYSLHAFNTLEYSEEWSYNNKTEKEDCWLRGIFHKNDGYQTPVVLNPMRTNGDIKIQRENELAIDRLISLFFNDKEERNALFTEINEKNIVDSLILTLDKKNVEEKWEKTKEHWKEQSTNNENESFFENLKAKITALWEDRYNKFHRLHEIDDEYDTAITYLVYKTIKAAQYEDTFDNSKSLYATNKESWDAQRDDELKKLIKEIDDDKSHITFRIRQTLAFLKLRHISAKSYTIDEFAKSFHEIMEGEKWRYIDLVPTHCFKTDILLKEKNSNNGLYSFFKLSSGERQLVYTTSSILYHIRNINSVDITKKGNKRKIKYNHINIILDEIELYFHPEFQRQFVHNLIRSIENMQFNIESINIHMATHSPFILSDIPRNNVLFLENGKSNRDMQEDTFGANIHTLLQNGFFLDSVPIGSFAKHKINEMFRQLHLGIISKELYNEILLVSEPFIRSQLLKKFNELFPAYNYFHLEEDIKKLRIEIENTKNNK